MITQAKAIIYGDTDSCYFTAYPVLKKEIEAGNMHLEQGNCCATVQ
jgi:hypothetical protein